MAVSNNQVVKEIRRKGASGDFENPVKIGADQKFVSSLLNSHNNNLEEQSILGVDCFAIEWQDDDIGYITKRYVDGQDTEGISEEGYYILFVTDYTNRPKRADFYFTEDTLHIPEYDTSGAKFSVNENTLLAEKPNIFFFESLEASPTTLIIRPAAVLREEVLCFRPDKTDTSEIRNMDTDILISEKITVQKIKIDGQSMKTYTQSTIKNYLVDDESNEG